MQVIKGQAAVQRCTATVDFLLKDKIFFPVTVNSKELHELFQKVGGDILGRQNVKEFQPLMGSEDFSFFADVIPGYFFFLGMTDESQGPMATGHSPHFTINEDALPYGAALLASLARAYLLENHTTRTPAEAKVHDEL